MGLRNVLQRYEGRQYLRKCFLVGIAAAALLPRATAQTGTPVIHLTLQEAEAIALKNNPTVTIARLNALAAEQVARQARAGLMPDVRIDLTGADSEPDSRIAAGGLNNPRVFERAAGGTTVSQLITDFGRTTNLYASSRFRFQAENQNAVATADQIILAVDQAFYNTLQTKALLNVAEETVATRQLLADQVQALTNAKLRSDLDLSFAMVNLAEAKLLLLDAQNNYNAGLANLSAVLGYLSLQNFDIVEDRTPIAPPSPNIDGLINEALAHRPEVAALNYSTLSAERFHKAERDLMLPTVRALGTVGSVPVGNPVFTSWWGAVGVNIDIPVFNGFLYPARAREALLRSQAEQQRLLDMKERIVRDVRTTWLDANTSYARIGVSQQLLQQANLALNLAQTRYQLGLGSIVEVSQAQLQQTRAQISAASAEYQYRFSLSALRFQLGR